MESKVQSPQDPTSAKQHKKCIVCKALLPMSHFSVYRDSADGHRPICRDCRTEMSRNKRWEKRGKPNPHDKPIRNLRHQNKFVLHYGFNSGKCEAVAFHIDTKADYKVVFGPSDRSGLWSISIFSSTGDELQELSYSGQKKFDSFMEGVLNYLKAMKLRLELSDRHAVEAKRTIYFY